MQSALGVMYRIGWSPKSNSYIGRGGGKHLCRSFEQVDLSNAWVVLERQSSNPSLQVVGEFNNRSFYPQQQQEELIFLCQSRERQDIGFVPNKLGSELEVCISPIFYNSKSDEQNKTRQSQGSFNSTSWARKQWYVDLIHLSRGLIKPLPLVLDFLLQQDINF